MKFCSHWCLMMQEELLTYIMLCISGACKENRKGKLIERTVIKPGPSQYLGTMINIGIKF